MTGQPPRLVFRFTQAEVAKMEEVLHDLDAMPKRPVIQGLIDHFNASPDRTGDGRVPVQYNQVLLGFPSSYVAQDPIQSGSIRMDLCWVVAGEELVP